MSTNINPRVLMNFIQEKIGNRGIAQYEAKNYGIGDNEFAEANTKDEDNYLDMDEIIDNTDVYNLFATMYVEEQEQKEAEANEEKEREQSLTTQQQGGASL